MKGWRFKNGIEIFSAVSEFFALNEAANRMKLANVVIVGLLPDQENMTQGFGRAGIFVSFASSAAWRPVSCACTSIALKSA